MKQKKQQNDDIENTKELTRIIDDYGTIRLTKAFVLAHPQITQDMREASEVLGGSLFFRDKYHVWSRSNNSPSTRYQQTIRYLLRNNYAQTSTLDTGGRMISLTSKGYDDLDWLEK